jgi:hypothetical protein
MTENEPLIHNLWEVGETIWEQQPTGVNAPQAYVYDCHIVEHEDNDRCGDLP